MKIITFNVNGIRAALKKDFAYWLKEINADAICIQEIKLFETKIVEDQFKELGYHCYWYPAQKKGYSGVSIFSKTEPKNVIYGIGQELFDFEGRVITAEFENYSIISAYFPSGTTGGPRQSIKYDFLEHINKYLEEYKKKQPNIVICGDFNICHKEIDIHNPKSNANSSGFLPEERAWLGKFIDSGFIDSFRYTNPAPHNYTWWSYRAGAREKNLGWRIDYIFVSSPLKTMIKTVKIHSEIKMSDHCPVALILDLNK